MDDPIKYFENLIKKCTPVVLKEYPDIVFYVKNLRNKKLNRILQLNLDIKGEVVLEKNIKVKYIFFKDIYWKKLNSLFIDPVSAFYQQGSVSEIIRDTLNLKNYYIMEGMMKYSKINNFF